MKTQLPVLALENLMKEKGAERVSQEAKKELRKILEAELYDTSIKAAKIASHAGRKTITEGDIIIARQ